MNKKTTHPEEVGLAPTKTTLEAAVFLIKLLFQTRKKGWKYQESNPEKRIKSPSFYH